MAIQWPTGGMTLQALLQNLSGELASFSTALLAIEDRVGDVIEEGAPGVEQLSVPLQGLDHLAQIARELANFVDSLSRSVGSDLVISVEDGAKEMGLRSLAAALLGHPSDSTGNPTDAGEVDLF